MSMDSWWKCVRVALACVLAFFAIPQNLAAQTHLVSPAELQKAAVAATQSRQHNIETVQQFLSSPGADKAFKTAHIDAEQVKQAVSSLNDDDLARVAQRAQKAQADFAAGRISDHDLLIILIVVAALILIIVAVH
jgi:hypothetical protein